MPMEASARLFGCVCCHSQVIICSCCDRGNIYCCSVCSKIARKKSLHAAGQRYQHSKKGRHKHTDRQKRYMERLKNKMTHHGSQVLPNNDLLPQQPYEKKKSLTLAVICHFCGSCCSSFIRSGFLRR
jgi:hypothetical protein